MKGKYRIIVENKTIKYDFEIRRNLTILKGDSATGKTQLIELIGAYYDNGADSGVSLRCEKECVVLQGRDWAILLENYHNSIVFIDEGNPFVTSKDFATAVQYSDNYYVIVTREAIATLPYSVDEIYGIRNSGKYGTLKQTYNELFKIYGDRKINENIKPDILITEDSNSGYQFFQSICGNGIIECITAEGKSNVFAKANALKSKEVLVIADGAAFGSEMEKMIYLAKENSSIHIYLPESFEWLLLKSGIVNRTDIDHFLDKTYEYVESKKYFSWEQFFTELLIQKTKGTYLAYSKKSLAMHIKRKRLKRWLSM